EPGDGGLDERAEGHRVEEDRRRELRRRERARFQEVRLGLGLLAVALEDEPEVVVRERVLGREAEGLLERGAGAVELAEVEEGERALVARLGVLAVEPEGGLGARQRLVGAAEVVERLGLEEREPRGELAVVAAAPDVRRAAPRVLEPDEREVVVRREAV